MTERLSGQESNFTYQSLPARVPDLKLRAEIFEADRNGSISTMNLKTGRRGPGEGCSNNCGYCDVGGESGPYWLDTPDEDDFKNFIKNWADHGGKVLYWCGDGEPTEFKWFDTVLKLAKEKNFKLEIFSNLAGLTPKRADKLMEIGAKVRFKMDSRNPITMGKILNKNNNDEFTAFKIGRTLMDNIDMLVEARDRSEKKPQLTASIVMSEKNMHDIIQDLDWCCKFNVVPQINYMEKTGTALETKIKPLSQKETQIINRWLEMRFGIEDPKQIMGDHCEARTAPILKGKEVYLGPFGMGCEFTLRRYLKKLNYIGTYQKNVSELKDKIKEFRFSKKNLRAITKELIYIKKQKGVYGKTGTDKILPGCGDDIEELKLLEYTANLFTSNEYFGNFIKNRVLKGEHRKWTRNEVSDLIGQVKNNFINLK